MLLAMTQGDRWLVGAIAGPVSLATYDLVSRAAVIPKFIAAALGSVVLPQRARLLTASDLATNSLYRNAQRVVVAVLGLGSAILVVGGALSALHFSIPRGALLLLTVLLAAHAIHGSTIVGALFVTAQHRPDLEVPAIAWGLAVFIVVGLFAALGPHGTDLVMVASPVALAVEGTIFLTSRPWLRVRQ
jgi:O-antigen/teichoic acid export membrane protein